MAQCSMQAKAGHSALARISIPHTHAIQRRINVRISSSSTPQQATVPAQQASPKVIRLPVTPLTPENFRHFGQVVGTTDDGKVFDDEDAQLKLDQGTPRFYIMRLPTRGALKFHRITYHAKVTQCLGGLYPVQDWYMAVSRPSGSLERYPQPEDIRVFKVPHGTYLKLEVGTWHAGPHFVGTPFMDFYNLELKDTNVVDHNTHDYRKSNNLEFEIVA